MSKEPEQNTANDLAAMLGTAKASESKIKEGLEDVDGSEPGENEEVTGESEEEETGGEAEGASADIDVEGSEASEEEGEKAEETGEESSALREQIAASTERLNAMDAAKAEKAAKDTEEEETTAVALPAESFIASDEELDEMVGSKEKMNAAFQKVATHAYNKALEETFRVLPALVTRMASAEVSNQIAAAEFYRANDDLVPHKASVQKIYMEMLGKTPEKNPFDVLKELAPEVRRRLKLAPKGQQMQQQQKKKFKRPAFAPAPGSGARAPSIPKGIGSEINQMLNLK